MPIIDYSLTNTNDKQSQNKQQITNSNINFEFNSFEFNNVNNNNTNKFENFNPFASIPSKSNNAQE